MEAGTRFVTQAGYKSNQWDTHGGTISVTAVIIINKLSYRPPLSKESCFVRRSAGKIVGALTSHEAERLLFNRNRLPAQRSRGSPPQHVCCRAVSAFY